jgi:hypothetical protein
MSRAAALKMDTHVSESLGDGQVVQSRRRRRLYFMVPFACMRWIMDENTNPTKNSITEVNNCHHDGQLYSVDKAYTNRTLIKQTIETNVKLDKTNTYPTNHQLTKQVFA